MAEDIHAILAELRVGSREGRAWRDRAEQRLDQTAESLNHLSHTLAELSTEMKLHLHYGRERVDRLEKRLARLDPSTGPAPRNAAVALGGGGFFGWLAGGGWDHLSQLLKRILP